MSSGGIMGLWLSQPCKISPGKYVRFLPIYLPHLHRGIRAVLDFALFGKLVRPTYAFYVIWSVTIKVQSILSAKAIEK